METRLKEKRSMSEDNGIQLGMIGLAVMGRNLDLMFT